jgi:hypothetical protein
VRVLTKKHPKQVSAYGGSPWAKFSVPVQIRFFGWPIWTALERLGKRLSNEGHGFSRAAQAQQKSGL